MSDYDPKDPGGQEELDDTYINPVDEDFGFLGNYDDDPVIFLEHRWLHNLESDVPKGDYRVPLGKAKLVNRGKDITIVALSYMSVEALHAVQELKKLGIGCDLIDLRSTSPLDWKTIKRSLLRTGRLLAVDSSSESFSVASEIIAKASIECHNELKSAPLRLAIKDAPAPTSFGLTKNYYIGSKEIFNSVLTVFNKPKVNSRKIFAQNYPHDVPGDWFKGPF